MNLNQKNIENLSEIAIDIINDYKNGRFSKNEIHLSNSTGAEFSDEGNDTIVSKYINAFDELKTHGIIKNYKIIKQNDALIVFKFDC